MDGTPAGAARAFPACPEALAGPTPWRLRVSRRALAARLLHAGVASALGLVVLSGISACARRAPGPDECHDLAVRWVLTERGARYWRLGRGADSEVLERTTECLTTPYDRDLVQCVTSGAAPRACLRSFQARRGSAITADR